MIRGAKGENIDEADDVDKTIKIIEQKLKTVGNKLEVKKSKEAILNFYDTSVSKLFEKFTHDLGKFNVFYIESESKIITYNSGGSLGLINKSIENARGHIVDNLKNIELQYEFRGFNREGFGEFNHTSSINLNFDYDSISISDGNHTFKIRKSYEDQLYEDEIEKLISSEIRRHKDAIEKKIQELKK